MIDHRIENYRVLTAPLVATLKLAGRLVSVDATVSPEDVTQAVVDARCALDRPTALEL